MNDTHTYKLKLTDAEKDEGITKYVYIEINSSNDSLFASNC